MPRAVIFGAGKVGRGFLAQLLHNAGWMVQFVERDADLTRALDGATYSLFNLGTGEVSEVGPVEAIHDSSSDDMARLVRNAHLLLTSIGGDNLAAWATEVSDAIEYAVTSEPVDLILCENHPNPAALVRRHLPFKGLGVAQAQVLRSCIEPTAEQVEKHGPLTVQVQDHWTLPLDADALVRPDLIAGIEGFEPKPEFTVELTRKLYTYNAINAAVCYLGAQAAHSLLAEAANDEQIASVASAVGSESSAALSAEYGFDSEEQRGWCERALAKYQDESISDPIERNCRDPIRKLGLHDRILGPIHLCLKHGLPHTALAATLRSALAYREPSDLAAQTLQQTISEHGEWDTLKLLAPDIDSRVESLLTPPES